MEIDAYILSHCEPAHHISGTCRLVPHLGRADDPLSVCDEEGSVIGVAPDGGRESDAGALPLLLLSLFSVSARGWY